MKNVSNEFLVNMNDRRAWEYYVRLTFSDGTVKNLRNDDLALSGCEISTSAGTSSLPIGNAYGKILTLSLVNTDDRWSEYDFFGCEIKVEIKYSLSDRDESITLGYFTVIEPETYGSTITLSSIDIMYKANKAFNNNSLALPCTVYNLFKEACVQGNLSYNVDYFTNHDYKISVIPDNKTCRDIIGLCSMIAGGNAVIDDTGRVKIISYSMDYINNEITEFDGGTLSNPDTPYSDGDNLDGGDFTFTDTTNTDAGSYLDTKNFHVLFKGSQLTVTTDDVIITGVKTVVNNVTYMSGNDGYVITVTNDLLNGNSTYDIQDAVNRIGDVLIYRIENGRKKGLKFRPFEINHVSYPIADVLDSCYLVDRKNRVFKSIITDINYAFKGFTTFKCTAESPLRHANDYKAPDSQTELVVKDLVNKERTEREVAIETMQREIDNSSGLYQTATEHIDGLPDLTSTRNIKITFDSQCQSEGTTDWCSFYLDYNGEIKAIFEHVAITNYAGKSIVIPNTAKITRGIIIFRTDVSVTYYGVQINSIELTNDSVTVTPFTPTYYTSDNKDFTVTTSFSKASTVGTPHPYTDNQKYNLQLTNACFPAYNSPLYYVLHNKPTMEDSDIWWVASAEVMWVSTDGGKTFNASINASGDAILNTLSAVGINADWINTGAITIGGSGQSAEVVVKNSDDVILGGWNTNGITFKSYDGNWSYNISHDKITSKYKESIIENEQRGTYIIDNVEYPHYQKIIQTFQRGYNNAPTDYLLLSGHWVSTYCNQDYGYPPYSMTGGSSSMHGAVPNSDGTWSDAYMSTDELTCHNFTAYNAKARAVETKSFKTRKLYCYETPTPYFGDIGEAETDEFGVAYVDIDIIFQETVDYDVDYQVFIQKYGSGDLWVEERTKDYFIIKGTPNIKFGWEVKWTQADMSYTRLEFEKSKLEVLQNSLDRANMPESEVKND